MTAFSAVLADIFDRNAPQLRLSVEEEQSEIQAAKTGDESATIRLMYAYAPALRNAVSGYSRTGGSQGNDPEDIRSSVVLGVLDAIKAYDAERHNRLAAVIVDSIKTAVANDLGNPAAFSIPGRTLRRFYKILRDANGNVYEAAAMAPQFHMSTAVFLTVLSAVRNVVSVDASQSADDERSLGLEASASSLWDNDSLEEDAVLVEAAFEAVDDLEEDVCRLAYGFADYDPIPDAEIGERLGFSRAKSQRIRTSALGKMRLALGVE